MKKRSLIVIIAILLITIGIVLILAQKGMINFRKNQNEQIAQSESGASVSGAYTQTDENGKVTAYDGNGTAIAQGKLQEDGTIKWGKNGAEYVISDMYGSYVKGYTPKCMKDEEIPSVEWRIFYADEDNIYLIADNYIHYDYTPTTSKRKRMHLDNNGYYRYDFRDIASEYNHSNSITSNNLASKWLSKYLGKGYNNMITTAYMIDTEIWTNMYEDKDDSGLVEYAIRRTHTGNV